MDEALVKHPQHDVHGQQCGKNEERLIAADGRVGGGGSLKAGDDTGRHIEARLDALDRVNRLAERGAFCNIERYSHYRKLTLVRDGERGGLHLEMGEGGEGHRSGHGAGGSGASGRGLP